MNSEFPKENYSLLNDEKKEKIMKDLREEIEKQKSQYSLNEDQIDDIKNRNIYNSNDVKNLNLNESENIEENTEREEEEHMEILNNAKNVLNQIQDDINNITQAYGLQNILPKKENNENANYLYEDNEMDNESSESKESNENELNTEEEKNNNMDINNQNEENKMNYEYEDDNNENEENNDEYGENNNEYEEENNEYEEGNNEYEEGNNDYEENNNEQNNYLNENQYDYYNNNFENQNDYENNYNIIQNQNKNASIQFNQINNQYKIDNTLYQNKGEENKEINPANYNKINYSKYNFDNPLGYDNELMKNNIKNYSCNNKLNREGNEKIKIKKNQYSNPSLVNQKKNNIKKNESKSKKINNISIDNILASKNREKFNLMKKELEDKFAKDHPFKPKINKKYKSSNKISETEQERYNRLSRPKIFEINEKKRKKDLEELKKISDLNSIKPNHKINPKDVSNRLYNLSRELKIKKDKIKKSYDESQNKEYSFTPEINPFSKVLMDKYEQKPIYERNEDFEKNKTNNIIKLRQEIEKEQKERCKPKINHNSRKIVQMQRNNVGYEEYEDVYDRLYKENINKDLKNLGNRELKECTFAPKVNAISNLLVSNNGQNLNYYNSTGDQYEINNENMKDFLERQKIYEDKKKKNLEKNKEKNKQYTFKPEINSNSDLLVKCNPERLLEKNTDKYSRLYQDAERIKQKKEKLENELNNKYDYTPKINELSKYIGRKPGIEELNLMPEKNYKNTKTEEEEYDFMPQIYQNSKYKNIKSNYKNDQGILNRINEEMEIKNKKIETLQKIKENDAISKFNFIPEINKTMPDFENKNNKPMYMKGMARYLNQMEKARQAKRDKEQREKEVFITGENWNKNNGITVPKPFKLSYQNNLKKDNHREKERLNEENKENQYKIKNNENKNREIIKKLLNGN